MSDNEIIGECRTFTGRHVFRARYSEREEAVNGSIESIRGISANDLRELLVLKHRTYHGDVCKRCGAVVNAPEFGEDR